MNGVKLEGRLIAGVRFMTVLAVVGSLAGSLLMFVLGLINIVNAYQFWLAGAEAPPESAVSGEVETSLTGEAAAVVGVILALDRFLIAIVLLYFAYGVYSLFIRPERREEDLALPLWFRVKSIGQLKQVVAEVILVVLFVLFLRVSLEVFRQPNISLSWAQIATYAVLPFSTFLLALALRFVELHPKPPRRRLEGERAPDEAPE